jgi:hypothetical protein
MQYSRSMTFLAHCSQALETEYQICAKGNGGSVDFQGFEVPALHRLHAGNKELMGPITCHDFDHVTVGIDGCPK